MIEGPDLPPHGGGAGAGRAGDPGTLLRPAADEVLRLWPVGKAVGNVRNDGPELLTPHLPPEPADTSGANPA